MCCLQKKHKGEKAGIYAKAEATRAACKKRQEEQIWRDQTERRKKDVQKPARPKQRAKEDIHISDSDLDDSSPTLNGYSTPQDCHSSFDESLGVMYTALYHHVQSWTCSYCVSKLRLVGRPCGYSVHY